MALDASLTNKVLFNDGEGLDFNDLNDVQTFERVALYDGIYKQMANNIPNGLNTGGCYSIGVGGAPYQTASRGTIGFLSGTIFQIIGATNGITQSMLPFTLTGSETVALTNGDGVNPRIDAISYHLTTADEFPVTRDFQDAVTLAKTSVSMNKRKRTSIVFTLTAGTPSATPASPIASIPVGDTLIAQVLIPTGYNAATTFLPQANVWDYRMPLGTLREIWVGGEVEIPVPANWGAYNAQMAHTNAAAVLNVVPPIGARTRIVSIQLIAQLGAGTTIASQNVDLIPFGGGAPVVANSPNRPYFADAAGTQSTAYNTAKWNLNDGVGYAPIWGNGHHNPLVGGFYDQGNAGMPQFRLNITTVAGNFASDSYRGVKFVVAD